MQLQLSNFTPQLDSEFLVVLSSPLQHTPSQTQQNETKRERGEEGEENDDDFLPLLAWRRFENRRRRREMELGFSSCFSPFYRKIERD